MTDVVGWIEERRKRGEAIALATVVATRRSAPRPVGAKLAVSESGDIIGSVSGGCVEPDVYEHARATFETGATELLSYGITDELAATVGLPCGGEIDVFLERLDDAAPVTAPVGAALLTTVEGERAGERRIVEPGVEPAVDDLLRAGRSGLLVRTEGQAFCEVSAPAPRLVVVGAVDLAEELCRAARALGWRTIVVDPRARFATGERLPSAHEIAVAWPEEALAGIEPDTGTAVVVVSHDDKIDLPALTRALASDAFYVGALGSRRTQARRRELLLDAGVPEGGLERLAGPAGLDLGADAPAEVALSILAEIVAVRNRRDGGRLAAASGRIHTASAA